MFRITPFQGYLGPRAPEVGLGGGDSRSLNISDTKQKNNNNMNSHFRVSWSDRTGRCHKHKPFLIKPCVGISQPNWSLLSLAPWASQSQSSGPLASVVSKCSSGILLSFPLLFWGSR